MVNKTSTKLEVFCTNIKPIIRRNFAVTKKDRI